MANNPLEDFVLGQCHQASRAEFDAYSDGQLLRSYVAARDEYAFGALMHRHERRIWAVCLRVLGHRQDAEDAFQATYLILAQKATKVQGWEALDGWLHNVAYKIATNAKATRERRRVREERKAKMRHERFVNPADHGELAEVLDKELTYVSETYRTPLILCYLEGLSHEQAAQRLNISLRCLKRRLAAGRKRMQSRLSKRGLDFGAATALAGMSPGMASLTPPVGLIARTSRTVRIWMQAQGAAGVTGGSTAATILADKFLKAGALKVKILLVLLMTTLTAAGGGVYTYSTWTGRFGEPTQEESSKAEKTPALGDEAKGTLPMPIVEPAERGTVKREQLKFVEKTVPYTGRVLDPDGKPVPGVKLFVLADQGAVPAPQPNADPGGRFSFDLPLIRSVDISGFWDGVTQDEPLRPDGPFVIATAPGWGMDWMAADDAQKKAADFHLMPEVPIRGRVIDLDGKPVAGVTVAVRNVITGSAQAFDEMIRTLKGSTDEKLWTSLWKLSKRIEHRPGLEGMFRAVTTADGSFTLRGIGQDHVVDLLLSGAGMAHQSAAVVTRSKFKPDRIEGSPTIHGPICTLVVAPEKPIGGLVRDEATKKPLTGIRVRGWAQGRGLVSVAGGGSNEVEATTDADGRFTLHGLPKAVSYYLNADPDVSHPYLIRDFTVEDTAGWAPANGVVELRRGVVLTGQVVDSATGAGVRSIVSYGPCRSNSNAGFYSNIGGVEFNPLRGSQTSTDAEGRYKLPVLSGPGVVVARAINGLDYQGAKATTQLVTDGIVDKTNGAFLTKGLQTRPDRVNAFQVICPGDSDQTCTVSFAIRAGISRVVKVQDASGKPLTGVGAYGIRPLRVSPPSPTDELLAVGLDAERPRRIYLYDEERNLYGRLTIDGKSTEPISVTLEPPGCVTGRCVDDNGDPVKEPEVVSWSWFVPDEHEFGSLYEQSHKECSTKTDADGRFCFKDIPPGMKIIIRGGRSRRRITGITVKSGEVKDIGVLK